ncbi:MAG: hypothetical protein UY70_C0008G0005 [Candidatus Kaiserbacteria bacterium GW2011_GWB1_52_6]|uniref:Polymerase beta nucleotidyltransferase domain-containing protein n=2 Tax=Candidatus Kaiseribacteriota TaxID=1752734 RepID=A0A0G1X9Q9_9BACT|nr:MAG: hypothetical protein UY67_C0031G0005 [Candidatus Kaiserbacteria bacterium GW2011_GWA2_52_12]KKW27726.1 MAG: hypothetical protein UY70_C0008G0005 [Candidatus Kaiserbacteria bacterium GW2011_GWB1_52_6]
MMRDAFKKQHGAAIQCVARARGLRLVVLYGSVARGTETRASDVDIAVLAHSPLSPEDEAVIAEELAHETGLPNIEVKSLHRVAPLFLDTVLREGLVLYEDAPDRARALSLYAWKLSQESKFLRKARYHRARERLGTHVG